MEIPSPAVSDLYSWAVAPELTRGLDWRCRARDGQGVPELPPTIKSPGKGHRVEGNLAPRCSCVPVKRAAVDISDEGETAAYRRLGFGVGVAAGIGDAGAEGRCRR